MVHRHGANVPILGTRRFVTDAILIADTDAGRHHMSAEQPTIIYTLTDEAPLLATYAFLPIVRTFVAPAGVKVKTSDVSVATRILAEFGDYLTEEQRVSDDLAELGELTQLPD